MPYLLPDDTTPTEFKCITIMIPDDPQWETTFWGALTELCKWFNFDRDEAKNATIVAHLWQEWIEAAMACNTITGIRVLNSWLEVQYCNSSTWVRIKKIMTGGIRYANGAIEYDFDGDDNYEVSEYLNYYNNTYNSGLPTLTESLDLGHICSGVRDMVLWVCERASSDMAHSAAVARGEELAIAALADMVTLGLGDVNPIDAFADVLFGIAQASYAVIIGQYNNSEFQEEIICSLYCLIKNSGQSDLTSDIYNAWKGTIPNWPFPLSPVTSPNGLFMFGGLADQMEHLYNYRHIYRRYWLYSHDTSGVCEGLCTECNTCSDLTMNLKIDKFCTVAREGVCVEGSESDFAVWVLGEGWRPMTCSTGTNPASGRYRRLQVYLELGSTVTITSIRWKWSGDAVQQNDIFDATGSEGGTLIVSEDLSPGEYLWSGSLTGISRLLFVLERVGTVANPPSGNWQLEEIEVTTE